MLASATEESPPDPVVPKLSEEGEAEADCLDQQMPDNLQADGSQHESCDLNSVCTSQDVTMLDGEISDEVEAIKQLFVERTKTCGIPQLEILYTRVMKGVFETKNRVKGEDLQSSILRFFKEAAEDESNF